MMKAIQLVSLMLCCSLPLLCVADGNSFAIVLKASNTNQTYCLDLFGQNTQNGSPLDIWKCDNTDITGQKWIFDKGSYKIRSTVNYSKCAAINGTKLVIEDCGTSPNQRFGWDDQTAKIFMYTGSASFDKCLRVDGALSSGTKVQVGSCINASAWFPREGPPPGPYPKDSVFNFKPAGQPSLCLGLSPNAINSSVMEKSPLGIYECSSVSSKSSKAQEWIFAAGSYRIRSVMNPMMCIDALPDMANGTQLVLWMCNGFPQQQWTFDGSKQSVGLSGQEGKCMDFGDAKTVKDGDKVMLGNCASWNLTHATAAGLVLSKPVFV
jgi:hypothetical protein